jgi:hypothetical protein
MSSKPFRFHPEAREEFHEAARWYRARNGVASAEFRAAGGLAQLFASLINFRGALPLSRFVRKSLP